MGKILIWRIELCNKELLEKHTSVEGYKKVCTISDQQYLKSNNNNTCTIQLLHMGDNHIVRNRPLK